MTGQRKSPLPQRPRGKTPAERSIEFDAHQARLKAEAAERRQARADATRSKPASRVVRRRALSMRP
jgi:hypothetical protein